MAKKAVVVLAEGFEEIEAVTPIDVLRRADIEVTVLGLGSLEIKGSRNVILKADARFEDYRDLPDAVVLPGGAAGARNLSQSKELAALLQKMNAQNRWIAAICASPAVVLAPLGFLAGKTITCFPAFEKILDSNIRYSKDRVVIDGKIITSAGPGTALEFSLALVERLAGDDVARKLSGGMLAK